MDHFDYKKYLKEGRIHKDFDQINEKKEDSKKGNKEEQKRLEGAIRDNRDHKFDIDKDEDDQRKKLAKLKKDSKKESGKGKKGNEDEQKRAEGAIKDAKDHKKNLNKDIKADEKKLAKLKKDFKKDVVKESEEVSEKKQGYNDRDDEAIGAKDGAEKDKKVSMKGRRDMSRGMEKAMGKRADSTDSKMDESALAVGAGVAAVFGGAAALAKIIDKLEAGDLGERGKKVADVLAQLGKGAANRYSEGEDKEVEEGYGKKPMYDEDDVKPMKESSKMKKSELKAKIKETILAELALAESGFEASDAGSQYHDSLYTEEEDVDVDVDFEDEVNVDAEGDDIEIEKPAVKAKVQVGLSPEETIVQDSLKAAMDAADALGNDKLADQIGNTITFFTREYVVGRNSD